MFWIKHTRQEPCGQNPAPAKLRGDDKRKEDNTRYPVTVNRIVYGDNLEVLRGLEAGSVPLIYIDPPFNTGKRQSRPAMKTVQDPDGDRVGFGGKRYRTELAELSASTSGYGDSFADYPGFLRPRLEEAHRILAPYGSLFFHIDPREVHYCKVMLDGIFGRECFQNEIIWAYDYGARASKKWPAKHDNILWYTRHPGRYTFNLEASDRIPYMAPTLVGAKKAARGKTPTDVWWHTIVSPTGKEKTGYATQKPLGILERIVRVHSNPGDLVLDFFAGSGTTGAAAARNGREFLLVDENPAAVAVMEQRLAAYLPVKTEKLRKPARKRAAGAPKKKAARKSISVKSKETRTKRGVLPPTDPIAT
ncbi:DNA-methyltransferase [Granulicella aggregans]|uniref:DNA-methyltransferase n=1 Tax=Granulicella aggregans TaxID=474949 RepID=UPI0021E07D2F|nr:site-specific DNA-methyltransferase [Granulicella aggregans]